MSVDVADTGCTGCNATIYDAQKTVGKVAQDSFEKEIVWSR